MDLLASEDAHPAALAVDVTSAGRWLRGTVR